MVPPLYAGIGGTRLDPEYGSRAIRSLFAAHLGRDEGAERKQRVRELFAELDTDSSGSLTAAELAGNSQNILSRLGLKHEAVLAGSEAIAGALLSSTSSTSSDGKNGPAQIRLDEFDRLIESTWHALGAY